MKTYYTIDVADVETLDDHRPLAQRSILTRRSPSEPAPARPSAPLPSQPLAEGATVDLEPDPEQMLVRNFVRFTEGKDSRPGCIGALVMVIAAAVFLLMRT